MGCYGWLIWFCVCAFVAVFVRLFGVEHLEGGFWVGLWRSFMSGCSCFVICDYCLFRGLCFGGDFCCLDLLTWLVVVAG